ncbi:UDP-N-acetylmuramoyl-L-alanyl-D-glutamate--2,6-diaminopimelate ligase [Niallia sp. XMNu-256]|uniref:UDP-N-acetylmuramoyl-L-alanyl-D-glutamate--2, 6-diaminopimelate ligase n=1 Tax=Niallia sp. XMNu-256 TaxID=3082444 RepID=UPI0030D34BCC
MLLTKIVENLTFSLLKGEMEKEISSISYDSREVKESGLFVAISGFSVDGHTFIKKAIENGATAIIVEKSIEVDEPVTIIKVDDSRQALAKVSANFYDHPTEKLNLIGITGTNGKTSTTYFVKSIFEQAHKSVGLIGTIGTVMNNKLLETKNTTPESLNLQQLFSEMVDSEIDDCIMEVSSHALSLKRTAYCQFNTGIFTNLTPDHLELHHTMEDYFLAKAELFKMTTDYNIINVDDPYGQRLYEMVQTYHVPVLTYGIDNKADIYASNIVLDSDYSTYTLHTPEGSIEITVNIPGIFNVYNSLAAIACAYCNKISLHDIQQGMLALENIKGRLEVIYQDENRKIVVDFAHTEDSLEKALTTLRTNTKGRILLVFGVYAAPGEAGRDKRRAMGQVAAKFADLSVVTSDNPKFQDPNAIIEEITEAMKEENGAYIAVVDRKEAIRHAIELCEKGDTILLAGKGHETSQVIGDKEIPFNEREIVMEILSDKQYTV